MHVLLPEARRAVLHCMHGMVPCHHTGLQGSGAMSCTYRLWHQEGQAHLIVKRRLSDSIRDARPSVIRATASVLQASGHVL